MNLKSEGCQTLHHFRTAPEDLDKPVKFIVGGDIYHDQIENVQNMMRQAAKIEPLFCVLGGDLAYSFVSKKSDEEQLDRWFTFLKTYQKEMVTPDGMMIPLLPILGNHEHPRRIFSRSKKR